MADRGTGSTAIQKITTYRSALYSGAIALVGILGLLAVIGIDWFGNHATTKTLLEQLSGLLITTGGLAVLWELRGKRDVMAEVIARVGVKADIETTGITRATMDWQAIPWGDLVRGAKKVDVFIAYGNTWLSTRHADLVEFAKTERNQLRYILPDPEDNATMEALAERFDSTPETIVRKIEEAAMSVAKLSRQGKADIRVWYRKGAPTYTCYRFDDQVVVTLYQHGPRSGQIPTLLVENGTFKEFFIGDLNAIVSDSREVGTQELLGGGSSAV